MLTLHMATENWREALIPVIEQVESDMQVDFDPDIYTPIVDIFTAEVIDQIERVERLEWKRASQQSVGAFAIVQAGTEADRATFDDIIIKEAEKMKPDICKWIKELA